MVSMKSILVVSISLFWCYSICAQPRCVSFKKNNWRKGGVKMSYRDVGRDDDLSKWAFDSVNNTYYRMRTAWGIRVPLKVAQTQAHPKYLLVEQTKNNGWVISGVTAPAGRSIKWYYDTVSGTYYGIENVHGRSIPIK